MATKEILLGNIRGKDNKISRVTATIDSTHLENPIVHVELGGEPGAQTIDFSFEGLQGAPGKNVVTSTEGSVTINVATVDDAGIVKPDGITITATADGTISVAELDSYCKVEEVESIRDSLEENIRTSTLGTYKIKGSSLFEDLPSPDSSSFGFVYNVLNDFTTDANFLVAQEHFPAGTNVVVVNDELGYKYDVFTGVIDLSDYVKKTDIIARSTQAEYLNRRLLEDSTDLDTLSGEGNSGLYYASQNSSGLLNTPEESPNSFLLEVFTGEDNETDQRITTTSGIIWVRHRNVESWTDWTSIGKNDEYVKRDELNEYKELMSLTLKEYIKLVELDNLLIDHIEVIREAIGIADVAHNGLVPKVPLD